MNQYNDLESTSKKIMISQPINVKNHMQILVIGDSQTGKSNFSSIITRQGYNRFVNDANISDMMVGKVISAEKTKGCDIHASIRNIEIDKDTRDKKQKNQSQYILKIFDITGDKTQRNYLDIYLAKLYKQLQIIVFCFDVTNLRTLDNFHKWIKVLLQNQLPVQQEICSNPQSPLNKSNNSETFVQVFDENKQLEQYQNFKGVPIDNLREYSILLVGIKMDRIPENKHQQFRQKITKQVEYTQNQLFESFQVKELFDCEQGENLFLLSTQKLYEFHSEYVRFEKCLNKLYKDKILELKSNDSLELSSSVSRSSGYQIQIGQINSNLRLDHYLLNRNQSKQYNKVVQIVRTYMTNIMRRICCKKQKQ